MSLILSGKFSPLALARISTSIPATRNLNPAKSPLEITTFIAVIIILIFTQSSYLIF
ncbi:MAG: hypothetical protein MI740_18850 [Halanaerobiales bacterium]|nr:hypothetical protein [Halanaerobiales bacterium]